MATTAHLGITLLEQSQAQKEVTANEGFMRIDALLNGGALDKDLATPPSTPAPGDVYIVAASPTGAWSGQAKSIAYFDQIWRFIVPNEGALLWVGDENKHYVYDGASWNAVLTGSGDMSKSTYDPANIGQQLAGTTATQTLTNKTLTTPTINQGNLVGTTTNNNAAAGSVGEFVSASVAVGSPVSLTTGTQTNITSISLTAGDWDVSGTVGFVTGGSATILATIGSISTTSATLGSPVGGAYFNVAGNVQNTVSATGTTRISIATTTTVYLVAYSTFTSGTQSAYGFIHARRVR